MSYFGMHNHTDFSNGIVIDSTNKVGSLLTKAKEMNFTGLAITDHGNISSHVKAIQFMKQKRKEDDSWKNFKLALGEEIYLCENGRNKETMERGQRYPHCILIAKDAIGHEQLRHISSLAWERSFTMFITRIPSWYSDIEKAIGDKKGHLIMTSACVGGFIAENGWKKNDMVKAVELVNWAKEWFGDDFYLEMAPAAYPEQKEYNLWLISLAKSTNTKLTIATDAHYLRPEDREIHSAFLKSKEEERETADFYQYTYLMTSDEVHELMDDYIDKEIVNEALANTNIALNGIGEYDLFQSQTIPHLSDDRINNKDWKINLKNTKVRNKFEYINKYINSSQEDDQYFIYLGLLKLNEMKLPPEKLELYLDRLEEELTECWLVSERLKQSISSYMLMVRKIIQIMWNEANSVVGVARGSAGVMLINYLIGITQMNPLEQGVYLPPWRFLQRDKIEIPDIDVDSEGGKKQLIIQKIKEAAQSDGGDALNICTFGTEGTRSAILTACRGLGIDIDDAQYLSGMVPQERGFLWPLSDCVNGNVDKDRKPVKKLIEAFEQFPRLLETAMGIEGLVSRIGIHACLDGTSKITTDRGIKNLSDVQCGDNVLTHKGSFKPVIKTMVNDTNEVYRIYSKGMIEPLIGTGNHPLLILRHGEEKWVDIEKLEDGDMVGTPINNQLVQNDQTSITKNEKMWYQIDQIERIVRNQKVYNLTVADDNSYVANGIITHNCGLLVLNDEVHSKNAMMRAPNGSQITQFDLGDSEYMGGLKMDCLSVEGMDKIHACLDLLLEDGLIEWQGSLKSTYDKYLHPDVLERDDEAMWKKIWDNEIIDIFQMDSTVGKQILATSKLKNIPELSAANSLMRLMPEPGHKTPADEYIEYKENPSLLKEEIEALNATEKEKAVLYDFMKQYGGVLDSQESAMLAVMLPEFTAYDVPHANKIRKIIAKKKMKEIDAAREEYFKIGAEKKVSEDILKYIWDVQIKRQLGYSFSLPHTVAYSLIALQEMNLSFKFPSVYWTTACMTVNAGGIEDEMVEARGTDYGKLSSAIGRVQSAGVNIRLPNINKARFGFSPDGENNAIVFGLKGITEVNDDFAKSVIDNRPYEDIGDFLDKTKPQNKQMINLLKAGCFDDFGDRFEMMLQYLETLIERKNRITLQNMAMLIKYNLIPNEYMKYVQLFNFNKYIKTFEMPKGYKLNNRSLEYAIANFDGNIQHDNNIDFIQKNEWDKFYKKQMEGIKEYLKEEEDILIDKIHKAEVQELWDKYCQGNLSSWEMDTLGFYYSGHELANINTSPFEISKITDLPYEPEVERYYERNGKRNPVFKISTIMGTVLDKTAYKHMVALLTPEGVINLKMIGDQFAKYNKTISDSSGDTKKTLEQSWFKKGTKLIVNGWRSGDQFLVRGRANEKVYPLYRIVNIDDLGEIETTRYRIDEVG